MQQHYANGVDTSSSVLQRKFAQRLQVLLDRSSPHVTARWCGLGLMVLLYTLRVWYVRGRCDGGISGGAATTGGSPLPSSWL